jgi:hypothetical protein
MSFRPAEHLRLIVTQTYTTRYGNGGRLSQSRPPPCSEKSQSPRGVQRIVDRPIANSLGYESDSALSAAFLQDRWDIAALTDHGDNRNQSLIEWHIHEVVLRSRICE